MARLLLLVFVWWTARLPVAVPDFHEVDHHHAANQHCLYHQHLNQWHDSSKNPGTDLVADHEPIFHVHWLMPGWTPNKNVNGTGDSPNGSERPSPEESESFLFLTAAPINDDTDLFAGFFNKNDFNQIRSFPANTASTTLLKLIVQSNNDFCRLNGFMQLENLQPYSQSIIKQDLLRVHTEMSAENQPLRC